MDNRQITFSDRVAIYKKKVGDAVKSAVLNDVAPGYHLKQGDQTPTIKALKDFTDRHRLADLLPYESYCPDTQLYFNIDTVGFCLYASPATGLSPTDLAAINGIFNDIHSNGTTIQVSLISDSKIEPILNEWQKHKQDAANENASQIFKMLAENRVKYLQKGKWDSLFSDEAFLLKNFHIIISYYIPVPRGISPTETKKEEIERLQRTQRSIIGTLRSANIFSDNLAPERLINILDGVINPAKREKPHFHYDDNNLISDQIVDEDTEMLFASGLSSIVHEEDTYTMMPFHVRQFPKNWGGFKNGEFIGSFTNKIRRLPCHAIITLTVNCPDQVSTKSLVKKNTLRATQMSSSKVGKFIPAWGERKVDWDFTTEKVEDGDKLLDAFYQILLIMPEGREQECEQALKSIYNTMGWSLARSRYIPMHAFLGALPMGLCQETKSSLARFGHFSKRLSWTCTNIAPWIAEWQGNNTPILMLAGRRGQLAYFDPFENTKGNFNMACAASPGSGKSFFTNEWIFSSLGVNGMAFVIDSGGSYKNLCELLEGTYIDFGEGRPNLNPFTKIFSKENLAKVRELAAQKPDEYSMDDYVNDMMPMLKSLISCMASPDEKLSAQHSAELERAIQAAISEHTEKTTITKVAIAANNLKDPDGQPSKYGREIALMLHSYTKDGMYGSYFEGDNNINFDNSFVVLELDALNAKGDLQSTVLLIMMMQISQTMYLSGNKGQRKLCIIDEAWRLLAKGRSGEFIEEGYRVARKHGGSFMTITQKVSDYFKSEVSKAAFMSSDFSIFLRQKLEELATSEQKGYIDNSDGRIDVLKTLKTEAGKYSELAVISPDGFTVERLVVDPVTEKIYSTKAQEVDFIRKQQAKGVPLLDAINELITKSRKR